MSASPAKIPASHQDLLLEAHVVVLTTVSAQQQPCSVAVWRRWDGEYLRITSDAGTRKHRNILVNPRVSVLALDPQNATRYLSIEGVVEEIVDRDVTAELDRQALMYTGNAHYFGTLAPAEDEATFKGVFFKIRPTRVVTLG